MLVDGRRQLLAADGMLLLTGERLRASAHNHLGAAKTCLLEQRLQPRLELVVKVVHEHDPRSGHGSTIRERRFIEFRVPIGADNGGEFDMVPGYVRYHVGKYAEACHDNRLVRSATQAGG